MRRLLLISCLVPNIALAALPMGVRTLADASRELDRMGINLMYSSALVDADAVLLDKHAETLRRAIETAMAAIGLSLLEAKPKVWLIVADPEAEQSLGTATVTGRVVDSVTGEPIRGARVRIGESRVRSDKNGLFVIGSLALSVTAVRVLDDRYRPASETIGQLRPGVPAMVTIELEPMPFDLGQMVISTGLYRLNWSDPIETVHFGASTLANAPNLGDDPLKSLSHVPGVASSGLTSRARIRGGAEDESLVVIDGIVIDDAFHLKDFHSIFSAINVEAVDNIEFYTGGFPIQFGNRMSGVIDIDLVDPPESLVGSVGFGLLNSFVFAGDRINNGRTGWLVSAREGGLHRAMDALEQDFGSPRFRDALGKLSHSLGNHADLELGYLIIRDELSINDSRRIEVSVAETKQTASWFRLINRFSSGLSATTSLSQVIGTDTRLGWVDRPQIIDGWLLEDQDRSAYALNSDWQSPVIDGQWLLRWGGSYRNLDADYRFQSRRRTITGLRGVTEPGLLVRDDSVNPQGDEYGGYLAARWARGDELAVELGVRWDHQGYSGEQDDLQLSTRANLRYQMDSGPVIRASWGQFNQPQAIHELRIGDGELQFHRAQRAEHAIIGVSGGSPDFQWRIEAYQKRIKNPPARFENLFDPLSIVPELQVDRIRIEPTAARSGGLEVSISGERSAWSWWANYAYSSVKDRVDGGGNVRRSWDQEHSVSAGASWQHGPWSFSGALSAHSGWPGTVLSYDPNTLELVSGARNASDYGVFRSVDFKASRRFPFAAGSLRIEFGLTNALNLSNECCVDYDLLQGQERSLVLKTAAGVWLPLVPTFGVRWDYR